MAYGTVSADVIQSSVANTSLGAGNASIMKNRIINGSMVIDQRNAGASVATSSGTSIYTVDRWSLQYAQTSKMTAQQNAGSVTPPTGFTNYLGVTSSAATTPGSTDYYLLDYRIEGYNFADLAWGTANALPVTLSFWVYSSLTGTFAVAIGGGSGYYYPATYTISSANTWTKVTISLTGATTGTYNTTNGVGCYVRFDLGSGSSFIGTANTWNGTTNTYTVSGATKVIGTSGATFYITGVQLEVGSSATGYEYRQYGQELALCQRYYENTIYTGLGQVAVSTTATATNLYNFYQWQFKATKRASPTIGLATGSYAGGSATITPSVSDAWWTAGSNFFASGTSGNVGLTASAEL